MDEKAKKVLGSLQGQCSKREYCRSDIRAKALKALDGDAAAADAVLERQALLPVRRPRSTDGGR